MSSPEKYNTNKYAIPDAEKADMEQSPVTAEEMRAAVEGLSDAPESEVLAESAKIGTETEKEMKTEIEPEVETETETEIEIEIEKEKIAPQLTEVERQERERLAIEDLRRTMEEHVPDTETKKAPPEEPPSKTSGGDGGGGRGPVVMHEGSTEVKRQTCEKCHGKGTRFFIFRCSRCGGLGTTVVSSTMKWSHKVIKPTSETPPSPDSSSNPESGSR